MAELLGLRDELKEKGEKLMRIIEKYNVLEGMFRGKEEDLEAHKRFKPSAMISKPRWFHSTLNLRNANSEWML